MGLLDGKVAVVTGAGRGIGRSHALGLAAAGASVVVNDVGAELLGGEGGQGLVLDGKPHGEVAQAVVDEIIAAGGNAVADATYIGSIEAAASIVEYAVSQFGKIDILVNNAGTYVEASTFDLDDQRFDSQFSTHVKGTMGTVTAAAKAMRAAGRGGRIINTISGTDGVGGLALYIAAKVAIMSFTLTAASELKEYGIMVNAVQPFAITRQSRSYFFQAGAVDPSDQATIDHIGPHQNTPVVVFLASDLSKDVTGRFFNVTPEKFSSDAQVGLGETYITQTPTVFADSWTPESIADAINDILH
jgi:NAD(P)-dependent dehydrogenase (short-subunit alcohol dehydrogenase family)